MLKLFRLITNIRFYAGIVCMIFLMLWFSKTDVLSFRWLPSLSVSTSIKQSDMTYLSKQKIADQAVLLTYANITLWHEWWTSSMAWLEDLDGDTVSKALLSIKNLQTIRSTNVLQMKDSQSNREWISTLLQQWQTTLLQSQSIASILQWSIAESQSQVNGCTSQKSQADEMYRQWLAANNATMIEQATTQAQQSSTCISTAGVSVKSLNGVLTNLNTEMIKTQKYITLVQNNQSLITQHTDLLGGEVPAQLVQLQKDFQSL